VLQKNLRGVKEMGRWTIAAMIYLVVVMGGYIAYTEWYADDKVQAVSGGHSNEDGKNRHGDNNGQEGNEGHGHVQGKSSSNAHGGDTSHEDSSEVNSFVKSEKDQIKIYLKDKAGNPVNELEVNHEKILHFIIVDDHLQKYYHVHPAKTGEGEFTIGNFLPDGFYKAFVDIRPKDLAYQVTPVPFIVGKPSVSAQNEAIKPDRTLTQKVDGETVQLKMSSHKANETVKLTFNLNKTNLTPYLGAMGHVVILDEQAQKFLHVHPANEKDTVFETTFAKPGIYKIWAEFKQNGKVRAFPFVVEID
jgi:hypothetical protein